MSQLTYRREMTRIVAVFVLQFCLGVLARAQAPVEPSSTTSTFQFIEADNQLLQEVNELDLQYERKGLVYRDPEAEAFLSQVGERLTEDGPAPQNVVYKFRILRDPMVNAFALPNGSIYVNTGLLALLENEAQLAAILSHEITHVTMRHAYLMNRSSRKKALTMNVLEMLGAKFTSPLGAAFGQGLVRPAALAPGIVSRVFWKKERGAWQ
jgi:predicted Zn-dependent protease